jgi:hypothetical protein
MNATDTMLCWNPKSDQVALVPSPDASNLAGRYTMKVLACFSAVRRKTFEQRKTPVYITAMQLIVRDQVAPEAVHRALLELDEYRHGCPADMPGAAEARDARGESHPGMF